MSSTNFCLFDDCTVIRDSGEMLSRCYGALCQRGCFYLQVKQICLVGKHSVRQYLNSIGRQIPMQKVTSLFKELMTFHRSKITINQPLNEGTN